MSVGQKRGRKRSAAEQERIYGPKAYRDWLHQQPCVITGFRSHIEQVHVVGGGVGRKAGWTFTVPMAAELHRSLHAMGVKSFEARWGVNLVCLAGMIQDRWGARAGYRHRTHDRPGARWRDRETSDAKGEV